MAISRKAKAKAKPKVSKPAKKTVKKKAAAAVKKAAAKTAQRAGSKVAQARGAKDAKAKPTVVSEVTSGEWLTPAEADSRAKGAWFTGYARQVRRWPATECKGDFDDQKIASGFVLFEGLKVAGRLHTNFHRSVIAVVGDLRVGRLVLGDAVLVVTGKVAAKDFVAMPFNEGIFAVGGCQDVDQLAAAIETPWFLVRDRAARSTRLFQGKGRKLVEVSAQAVDRSLLDDGELDYGKALGRLQKSQTLLR